MEMPAAEFTESPGTNLITPRSRPLVRKRETGMRRVLISTISLLALSTAAAVAADIPRPMPYKAPALVAPMFNWTGLYVGLNAGYGWGRSNWSGVGADASPDGGLVGLTMGYNWQAPGSALVLGLEGDINWANFHGSFANGLCPAGCQTRSDWFGTVRGRLGFAIDRVMPYITGGLAFGDIQANPAGFSGVSNTNVGWTLGAGIEAALAPQWSAKLEYLYIDLGDVGCGAGACPVASTVDLRTSVLRVGFNYRF